MPNEHPYNLQELAALAGVTPRTIRYYIAQGLLPAPGSAGPAASYTVGHLGRLRLIRQLQRDHLPLAEIRGRLASLDDDAVAGLVGAPSDAPAGSAIEYIRGLLAGPEPTASEAQAPAMHARSSPVGPSPAMPTKAGPRFVEGGAMPTTPQTATPNPGIDRSQWDRIALALDIELHIRRPLSRLQNKRVDRLIAIARELLEEDPS